MLKLTLNYDDVKKVSNPLFLSLTALKFKNWQYNVGFLAVSLICDDNIVAVHYLFWFKTYLVINYPWS